MPTSLHITIIAPHNIPSKQNVHIHQHTQKHKRYRIADITHIPHSTALLSRWWKKRVSNLLPPNLLQLTTTERWSLSYLVSSLGSVWYERMVGFSVRDICLRYLSYKNKNWREIKLRNLMKFQPFWGRFKVWNCKVKFLNLWNFQTLIIRPSCRPQKI